MILPEDKIEAFVDAAMVKYDKNKSGVLQANEVQALVNDFFEKCDEKSMYLDMRNTERLMNRFKKDAFTPFGTYQVIQLVKYLRNEIIKTKHMSDEQIYAFADRMFVKFDKDKSGYLDHLETFEFVKLYYKERNVQCPVQKDTFEEALKRFGKYDKDGDSRISRTQMPNLIRAMRNLFYGAKVC